MPVAISMSHTPMPAERSASSRISSRSHGAASLGLAASDTRSVSPIRADAAQGTSRRRSLPSRVPARKPRHCRELPPMARRYEGRSSPKQDLMGGWPTDLASAPRGWLTGPADVNDPPQWAAMLQSLPLGPVHGEAPEFSAPQPPGV